MRVGIDARFLTHPQRGGFKSYTCAVVSVLGETDGEMEYILYTDRDSDDLPSLPKNFTVKPVGGLNSVVREQLSLPWIMIRDRVDVAHFLCNTAPLVSSLRTVVTMHDAIPLRDRKQVAGRRQRLLNAYWRFAMPRNARSARLVLTNTEYARADLSAALDMASEKFRVIPLAVDPVFANGASGDRPEEIPGGAPFVLAFASSDGRKNHRGAIKAFQRIASRFTGLKLAVVCAYPDLRKTVEIRGDVVPLGPVSMRELLWLYRNALLLVFPSFDEGFGLPPLEAMSCGLPVVASNAGSLPEVLGDSAFLVDPARVDDIAHGMRLLIEDRTLRDRLIRTGKERASLFSRQRMGCGLANVYAEVARME